MEHVPEEEIDMINYLFLSRQDVELHGLKISHGATKCLGVNAQGLHLSSSNAKHRKKIGCRTNKEALFELGQLLLNLGKMKTLEAFTFTS